MKTLIITLFSCSLLFADPIIRNRPLDSSAAYWMIEGSCGYIALRTCGADRITSFALPVGFCIFKEIAVDHFKFDIFGPFDEPDDFGLDYSDICFSVIGTMLGFLVHETWSLHLTRSKLTLTFAF